MSAGSGVDRVRAALLAAAHDDTITTFPEGTHTSADAAAAIGCSVAQIAKSIVFKSEAGPVLVVASGVDRIDRKKVAAALGAPVKPADPEWVAEQTGFAVGGVAPVGHQAAVTILIDAALQDQDPVWAAAGSPAHVFRTTTADLARITGGALVDVRQDPA